MSLNNTQIAQRLQSWTAFFSNELWMQSVKDLPLLESLDAILAGPPAWVTRDPLPEDGTESPDDARPCLESLLIAAWGSGDAELTALADHCEDLGTRYMQAQEDRQH